MNITEISDEGARTGRISECFYQTLRNELFSGRYKPGQFLAPERVLSHDHEVAVTTVRRALKRLMADGLIQVEPRKGYRVLNFANDPALGCPIAYVRGVREESSEWDEFHARISAGLQLATKARGWPLLAFSMGMLEPSQVAARLRAARTSAVILDTNNAELVRCVKETGIPSVMLDSWVDGCALDSVMQDGHEGGVQAARYLSRKGCKQIAWFGPVDSNVHTLDRFGGFCAGLLAEGKTLDKEMIFAAQADQAEEQARQMLSKSTRPDGVVALWRGQALAVQAVACERGLMIGRDLHLVGWSSEELRHKDFPKTGRREPAVPLITWNIAEMTKVAVSVLSERRLDVQLPPLRIRIPVRLSFGT